VQQTVRRFPILAAAIFTALCLPRAVAVPGLSKSDVETIVAQAAAAADQLNKQSIIAVTDREGFLLALWDAGNQVPTPLPAFALGDLAPTVNVKKAKLYGRVADAVTKASTAAFLSSDQNAFTTRTAGYIIQQHFPVGVRNAGPGPLVGVGFSSLFFTDVNRVKLIPPGFRGDRSIAQLVADGTITLAGTTGVGGNVPPLLGTNTFGDLSPGVRAPLFPFTSLNDSPGGVPLYKGGHLVGGIGITGDGDPTPFTPAVALLLGDTQKSATTGFKTGSDPDEEIALLAQTGFRPPKEIHATNVLINGVRIPYVDPRPEDIRDIDDVPPLGTIGRAIDVPIFLSTAGAPGAPGAAPLVPNQAIIAIPGSNIAKGAPQAAPDPYPYEVARLGGFEGEIRFPFRDDPLLNDGKPGNDHINGARRLQKEEVKEIISLAAERARITRAGIRLPIGTSAKVFIAVVSNPNKQGGHPQILGVFRTGEATVFSWDVAVQKARTAVMFSNTQLAMSSRTVGFLAQRFFPPGIDGTSHGPYFGFQEAVTLKTRAGGLAKGFLFPGNPNVPNGITIFPGGFPLYKDGQLVGAIGISGDGVDQDDIIGISGTVDFSADPKIRADQFSYRGARLPYVKFPRDPVR
jgi:uncharacterized protein GlcG (DUF336 family)